MHFCTATGQIYGPQHVHNPVLTDSAGMHTPYLDRITEVAVFLSKSSKLEQI